MATTMQTMSCRSRFGIVSRVKPPNVWTTGQIEILPYLEQDNVAKKWNRNEGRNGTTDHDGDGLVNDDLQKMIIPTFMCPTMTLPSGPIYGAENRAPTSYIFCAGTQDVTLLHYASAYGITEPAFDGAIVPLKEPSVAGNAGSANARSRAIPLTAISDGTSNTVLVGETDFKPAGVPTDSPGGIWAYGYIGYSWGTSHVPFNKHDGTGSAYGAFRSEHTGGANFALADGSVRFVRDSIDPVMYQRAFTRAGGDIVTLD